jgi:F-type H+-transporting ATPase subunit b
MPYVGDLGQAIASVLIFAVLVGILGRYAWRPVIRQLHQREQQISETIERSEKREKKAEQLLEQYRRQLAAAESEAAEVLAQSRREAADAREEMLQSARDEAEKSVRQAKQEIEEAKQVVLREMYDHTAELATDVAAQVLRHSLDEQEHDRLLNASLEEIRQRVSRSA